MRSTTRPLNGLELIEEGLAALAEMQPGELDGIALAAQLTDLQTLLSRLAAQMVRRIEVFHIRGDAAAEGMNSTAAFLTYKLRMSRAEARQQLAIATQLPRLTGTAAAFEKGEISARHAAVISIGAEQIGPDIVADAEPILLEVATTTDPGKLRRVVQHLRHVVDPNGEDEDAAARFDKRGLDVSTTFDGMVAVNGLLDPDTGAALFDAVNSGPPPSKEDRRSASQRRADRLGEVLRGESPTQVTLTVGLEALQGARGKAPAYLKWLGPLDSATTRLFSCDCQVTGVITDRDGSPLNVGWKHRTVTAAQRTALAVRDEHCQAPGCDHPAQWCDAHHVIPWYDGGRTDLGNLVLLCRRHHRAVHHKVWRVHALGGGRFRFELLPRPPREHPSCAQRAPARSLT